MTVDWPPCFKRVALTSHRMGITNVPMMQSHNTNTGDKYERVISYSTNNAKMCPSPSFHIQPVCRSRLSFSSTSSSLSMSSSVSIASGHSALAMLILSLNMDQSTQRTKQQPQSTSDLKALHNSKHESCLAADIVQVSIGKLVQHIHCQIDWERLQRACHSRIDVRLMQTSLRHKFLIHGQRQSVG